MDTSALGTEYEYFGNHNHHWGGFSSTLEEAQQECQGVALGPLHWEEGDMGIWEAVDPETETVFEVNLLHALPF